MDAQRSHRAATARALAATLVAGAVLTGAGAASAAHRAGTAPVNAGLPTISGTTRVGATLTASAGVWGGSLPITYANQWQQCDSNGTGCVSIAGATKTTLTLTSALVGKTIRVQVVATNSAGSARASSVPSAEVAPQGDAPANTAQPDPSGVAQEGQKITVNSGSWIGTAPITFGYRWQRCAPATGTCLSISGATGNSYLIVGDDVGSQLRAEVTATNSIGTSNAFSNLTDKVLAKGKAPANVTLPVITGNAAVGNTVKGYPGAWAGAQSYAFSWQRCNSGGVGCSDIPGATSAAYTVATGDAQATLRFKVTASNDSGSSNASSTALEVGTSGSSSGAANTVHVSQLTARPDHLLVSQVSFSPSPFKNPGGTFTIHVKVGLEGTDKVVQGALVYVTPVPYNWASASAEVPTGADGTVAIKIHTTKSLPHNGALVMQVRARGPGNSEQDILGGISTRRLVQLTLG